MVLPTVGPVDFFQFPSGAGPREAHTHHILVVQNLDLQPVTSSAETILCLYGTTWILSDTMYSSISSRESTPPQNHQLNILISNSEKQVDDFVGELTF